MRVYHSAFFQSSTTCARLALAWLLKKKPFVVPLCGMKSENRMEENFGALDVELSHEVFEKLERELSEIRIYGDRKDSDITKLGTVKSLHRV